MTQSVLLTSVAAVLTVIINPLIGGLSFNGVQQHWLLAFVMITSSALGNILFFKALEKLDASDAQVLFSSILIWSTILSLVFLHSIFSLKQLLGIALLMAAILLIQFKKNVRIFEVHALYMLAAAGLFAVFQVTSAEMAKTISTGAYSMLAYLGGTLLVGGFYFKPVSDDFKKLARMKTTTLWISLFASASSLLFLICAYLAFQTAPDRGIVVLLLTSQVVFGVILAIIFLRERSYIPKKLAAGVLAVVAGILIK